MGGFLSHLTPEVNTDILDASCGPLRGNVYRHDNNKIVDGYLGIPYAEPPIGELRFKKPLAAKHWTETRDCTKYGPCCPPSGAYAALMDKLGCEYNEDNCLTLNVFSPRSSSSDPGCGLPVMVFIHGGGYELGSSSGLHDYSLTGTLPLKDVILVTINYRVGILGFLTTGDDICRGNMGLWDQTMALKWVHNHIKSFGGNPDNVTLIGESAGSTSADLLSLSPHSNELFNRVILMSGTSHCNFALNTVTGAVEIVELYAKSHGYTGNKCLLDWYRTLPTKQFREVEKVNRPIGTVCFAPCFDSDFFPKPLDELRRDAPKKEILVGVGEHEGLTMYLAFPIENDVLGGFKKVLDELLRENQMNNVEEVKRIVLDSYTKEVDLADNAQLKLRIVNFLSDVTFNCGTLNTAQCATKYGNDVYLYSFEYCNPDALNDPTTSLLPFVAATHGTDLVYLLGQGVITTFTPNETDLKMIGKMGTIFSNFAKYGNPNGDGVVEWEKYSIDKPDRYYQITMPDCQMKNGFQNGRLDILDDINNKYGKKYQHIIHGNNI